MSFITNQPGNLPGGVPVNTQPPGTPVTSDITLSQLPLPVQTLVGLSASNALPIARSTDGTGGYSQPTGVGYEVIWITSGGRSEISDMTLNGVSG